jgi:predicted MFS family arabinose efflux permease
LQNVRVTGDTAQAAARFRDVFADHEFRALWLSQVLSVAGDRLALVALTLLVYQRTGSALETAAAYAAGFVPWVVGGLLLARIADRWPRRQVMVGCDLVRAILVAIMVVPGLPLLALVALLFAATCFAPPFEGARAAITPDILHGERYVLGTAIVQSTYRTGMVVGYAVGGSVVAAVGSRPALAADAATFALSAAVIRFGVRRRPAADEGRDAQSAAAEIMAGMRLVFSRRRLRILMLLGWLVAFYAVPEGVAAPYAHRLGEGGTAVGLILAAGAFGGVLAAPVFSRLAGPTRRELMGPFAAGACAVLILCLAKPNLAVSLVIFAVSGMLGIYQIAANTEFVVAVPPGRRAQAFGIANTGLIVGQGATFVLAGAAAQVLSPSTVVAIAGAVGALAAIPLVVGWRRDQRCGEPASDHVPQQARRDFT